MPEVRKFTSEDLSAEGQYISVLSDGVVLLKSIESGQIEGRINPETAYVNQLSKGGRVARQNTIDNEVKQLLTALDIDPEDERAKFLAKASITGKSGDNLRSFLALVEMFRPEQVVSRPVQRVYLSDRAYQDYIGRMIKQGYIPKPWMSEDPETLPDTTDGLMPFDIQDPEHDVYLEHDIKVAAAIDERKGR